MIFNCVSSRILLVPSLTGSPKFKFELLELNSLLLAFDVLGLIDLVLIVHLIVRLVVVGRRLLQLEAKRNTPFHLLVSHCLFLGTFALAASNLLRAAVIQHFL